MCSDGVLSGCVWMVYVSYHILCVWTMFFWIVCEWFTSHTALYAFGRCSFGLYVNGLRLIPLIWYFMRSDDVLSGCVWILYVWYDILCVRMMFFWIICKWFTLHTAFYAFEQCSFSLCVNGLRLIPRFVYSDDVLSGYMWMVYAWYRVLCVRTMFFRVMREWFTLDTVFSSFRHYFFGLCVNGLRILRHFPHSYGIILGYM